MELMDLHAGDLERGAGVVARVGGGGVRLARNVAGEAALLDCSQSCYVTSL